MDIRGIDHIELYVGDARQAAFYFCRAVGFGLLGQGGPETGLTGQRSLLLGQADIRMLLTSGLTAEHPAARYVQRHGDGIAVVALEVDDAVGAYAELLDRGATAVTPPTTVTGADAEVVTAEVGGFGDVVHRLVQRRGDRRVFLPGAMLCRIRWQANDYGTIRWQLMVMQACTPLDAAQRIPGVQPGARLLLHTEGDANVRAVLERIDGIEAQGIAVIDVSPAYWRTLGNRLAARSPLPEYTAERHAAWLAGKVLP